MKGRPLRGGDLAPFGRCLHVISLDEGPPA